MENSTGWKVISRATFSKHLQKDNLIERNTWGRIHTFLSYPSKVPTLQRTAVPAALLAPRNSEPQLHCGTSRKQRKFSFAFSSTHYCQKRARKKKPPQCVQIALHKRSPGFAWQCYQNLHLISVAEY